MKWNELGAQGRPIGDSCGNCYLTWLEGYPHYATLKELRAEIDQKPELKRDFAATCKRRLEMSEAFDEDFPTPSEVLEEMIVGHMTYYEVALLTEADLTRMFGKTPKALGLTAAATLNEHGQPVQSVYHVGLPGPLHVSLQVGGILNSD